jgi:hypothetical protein
VAELWYRQLYDLSSHHGARSSASDDLTVVQTCPNKDITLHVSANNSAMILYQRFGFKPEQFIRDFYHKYLPPDSKHSRHAFLLRLLR